MSGQNVRDRPDIQRMTAQLLAGARSDETREALKNALDNLHKLFQGIDDMLARESKES